MSRATLALVAGIVAAGMIARPATAQAPHAAVVVQVAGQDIYLDAGSDAGLQAGDTVGVQQTAGGPVVGSFAVVAAARASVMVNYAGAPFPLTRGDTVYVGVRAAPAPAALAPVVRAAPAATRITPSLVGALGFEMAGTRTTTLGLGSDPVSLTQDYATPAVRLRASMLDPAHRRELTLNLRAEHRAGPASLFDRSNTVRVYDVHVDQGVGIVRLTAGRFLSEFDHASGFWDGAALRVGRDRGLNAGIAGGFEPMRTNEAFSTNVRKYGGFLTFRARNAAVRYDGGVAMTRTAPVGGLTSSIVDFSQRLDAGKVHLAHEIEMAPAAGTLGNWTMTRLITRGMISAGQRADIYATYVRDHPSPMDSVAGFVPTVRERVAGGLSYHAGTVFANLDASINSPRDTGRAYALSLTLGIPTFIPRLSAMVSASYFTGPWLKGVLANPSLEYRAGGTRLRAGYQLYQSQGTVYSFLSHGADFSISQSLARRVDWVTRVNVRLGGNLRSAGAYSSLDFRF